MQSRDGVENAESPQDGDLDFGAIGRALWRKKWWVIIPAALIAVLSFAIVNIITPRYKSEARILYEGRESVFTRPEAEKGAERDRTAVDQEAVTSQVQLALSREVARDVIAKLKLSENPEFDPALRGIGLIRRFLIVVGVSQNPLRLSPEERVFESYYQRVQAYQIDKSRVIAIEFQSGDPDLAARGANAVAEAYLAQLQVVRRDQTKAAGQWLAGEIETLRARVAEAESKVEQFRSKSNLFVGPNNSSLSNQSLGEVNSQIAAARAQQADAETKARLIRAMLQSGRPIEAGEVINSELIRRLNEQRVVLSAQLAEQSSTLLGNHPRIKELRAQIADLERAIRAEAERIVRSLENDARIAAARVEQLAANLDALKRQAASTNEQDVQLRALEREAKAQRDLLESYLAKYRETTARETLGATAADARVISRAIVSNTPYFPKKLPIVLIATLASLVLGAGFITTGELLAGNVYRPGGLAPFAPAGGSAVRFEPYEPGESAALPPVAANAAAAGPVANQTIAAAVEALRAQPGGRSRVAVVGLTAEADTAAAARAVARALSAHARAAMVDLSFSSFRPLPKASGKGVADLVRGKASFGEIIARDSGSPVHIIAAGDSGNEASTILSSERLVIALDALERAYEHVVMDFGPLPDVEDDRLVRLAPCVVLFTPVPMKEAVEAATESLVAAGCRTVIAVTGAVDGGGATISAAAA